MQPIVIPVGVKGRVRWAAYDEQGERVPVLATYPDGRQVQLSGGHWQPNLITNQGMDAFADTQFGWVGLDGTHIHSIRRYGRIGTGSVTPAFTDTTLGNQVECSDTASPFTDDSFSATEDGDEITLHLMRRVTFVMSQNRNLTEYGFGNTKGGEWVEDTEWGGDPGACAGEVGVLDTSGCMGKVVPGSPEECWEWNDFNDIYVRELFRDSGGTPITISILAGKTLRIDHVYDVTLDLSMQTGSFDVEEYDAANQYVGTTAVDYNARWWSGRSSSGTATENGRRFANALRAAAGEVQFGFTQWVLYSELANPDISTGPHLGSTPGGYTAVNSTTWTTAGASFALRPYVPGSHENVYDMTISAARGNFDWTGWGYRNAAAYDGQGSQVGGFVVAFRNDHAFTKADTHTLRWSVKYAWSRG